MKRDGWISGIAVIVVGGVIAGAQSSSSTANPQTDPAAGGIGTDGGGDLLRTLMPDWCGLRGRTSFFDGGKDNKCGHGRRVGAALNGRAATAHALRLLALATLATRARLLRCSTDGS